MIATQLDMFAPTETQLVAWEQFSHLTKTELAATMDRHGANEAGSCSEILLALFTEQHRREGRCRSTSRWWETAGLSWYVDPNRRWRHVFALGALSCDCGWMERSEVERGWVICEGDLVHDQVVMEIDDQVSSPVRIARVSSLTARSTRWLEIYRDEQRIDFARIYGVSELGA